MSLICAVVSLAFLPFLYYEKKEDDLMSSLIFSDISYDLDNGVEEERRKQS